jgi:hypothetical protein
MKTFVFHTKGVDATTALVKAESEVEARGILQKNTVSGIDLNFKER